MIQRAVIEGDRIVEMSGRGDTWPKKARWTWARRSQNSQAPSLAQGRRRSGTPAGETPATLNPEP